MVPSLSAQVRRVPGALLGALLLAALCGPLAMSARPTYDMDLSIDWETGTYVGEARVTTENSTDQTLDRLVFRLFPNDRHIYTGASLEVVDATQSGTPLGFEIGEDPTILTVPLLEPLQPEQTVSLTLRFEGTAGPSPEDTHFRYSGFGLLTKNSSSLVLTAFYPLLAPFGEEGVVVHPLCENGDSLWSDSADYTVRVIAPAGLDPASSGRLVSSSTLGDIALHAFEVDMARDFALVLTSGMEQMELASSGRAFRTWFDEAQSEAAAKALAVASDSADLFTELLGPLPFHEVDLVEVPLSRAAGVEYTGLILLSSNYAAMSEDDIYTTLVAHEVAHQWFYAAVGNDPDYECWLDEGPAIFLANVFLDHVGLARDASGERSLWKINYEAGQATDPGATIATPNCDFGSSSSYALHILSGGPHFLQALRTEMGDEAFFHGLRSYVQSHIGRIGTTDALLDAFTDACECDLSKIYQSFGFDHSG